jgi:hypothetical protein
LQEEPETTADAGRHEGERLDRQDDQQEDEAEGARRRP